MVKMRRGQRTLLDAERFPPFGPGAQGNPERAGGLMQPFRMRFLDNKDPCNVFQSISLIPKRPTISFLA